MVEGLGDGKLENTKDEDSHLDLDKGQISKGRDFQRNFISIIWKQLDFQRDF